MTYRTLAIIDSSRASQMLDGAPASPAVTVMKSRWFPAWFAYTESGIRRAGSRLRARAQSRPIAPGSLPLRDIEARHLALALVGSNVHLRVDRLAAEVSDRLNDALTDVTTAVTPRPAIVNSSAPRALMSKFVETMYVR